MSKAADLSNQLVHTAIHAHASDIHFVPDRNKISIYFRCNGNRQYHTSLSCQQYMMILSYYKYIGNMDIGESRKPQQGAIYLENHGQSYSLRLSILPTPTNESLAIRILPQQHTQDLPHLFLFPFQLQQIYQWLTYRSGLILLTGATGTGKTTLLYALIKAYMEQKQYQTITLEDPIEKRVANILQLQINDKAGMTYDAGLKAALRHDPDIIMVGEIRDAPTAHFAFRAASTGHLVLSTLHARDAVGTIHRLEEMGVSSIELEHNLLSVASIQLLSLDTSNQHNKRRAIMEFLDQEQIQQVLTRQPLSRQTSFQQLKRKAFAYGFTSHL
ncbi:competence type IV pilus ATPase ComGA [Gracilibacillus alcaliphilus]|uniref:competence type IV pilus ATPase ComGA n=1 Tax=Gracilibacillus alcaliphilus TaxID=1401441 RepID=UPI00195635F0|nr:competence type IV pilus ATPase ComGA [Gracilibacillus alcaliphilus]MBM7675040.1 competence protein ComGA [Gracilibacillus alcaliphilus]